VQKTVFFPGVIQSDDGKPRCYIPVYDNQLLCSEDFIWEPITGSLWRFLNPDPTADIHYIGDYEGQSCFVVSLSEQYNVEGYCWNNLRVMLGMLNPTHYEMTARALQIVNWDIDHRFCGRCGDATLHHSAERAKVCVACKLEFYPRLSPCVITVVTRGEYCLLAHNPTFPDGYYSALAGFIEAGEGIESALRREVKEEVNVTVGKLSYFGSQSWPFPGQLMIGFHSEYELGDVEVDGVEIVDANWYRFDQLPLIPPASTLSGQLIQSFVNKFH
jgi:NAD+ diphosphatase